MFDLIQNRLLLRPDTVDGWGTTNTLGLRTRAKQCTTWRTPLACVSGPNIRRGQIKGQAGQIVRCLCIHGITRISRSKQPRFIYGVRGHASATTPECRKQFEYHPSPHRTSSARRALEVILEHFPTCRGCDVAKTAGFDPKFDVQTAHPLLTVWSFSRK